MCNYIDKKCIPQLANEWPKYIEHQAYDVHNYNTFLDIMHGIAIPYVQHCQSMLERGNIKQW